MYPEEEDFSDQQGDAESSWTHLPPEREFFASPYDPPVKALIQEISDGDLVVRPSFQRASVWDQTRQSRFVESILLNIPIPNLFFAEDDDKTKVVVDGQQRLLALKQFRENRFALRGLEALAPLNGKRFEDLTDRQQKVFSNRTLRCLVISAKSDSEIRFQVFERLNQGGVALNAQEVRHCVYRGSLNELLHAVVDDPIWLAATGKQAPSVRMVDCELVLRFLCFRERVTVYSPPLKGFLNDFMRDRRTISPTEVDEMRNAVISTVGKVSSVFGGRSFRRAEVRVDGVHWDVAINRAVFDAQMLVFEKLDKNWVVANADAIRENFIALCADADFSDSVSRATADVSRLRTRVSKVAELLNGLGAGVDAEQITPPQVA